MFKISRKVLVIGLLAIVLVVTGVINWKYISSAVKDKTENDASVETASFFTTYKSERSTNREDEMTYLESVITNANTDTETLNEAQQMKLEIVNNMELENNIEGILVAKGFEDAVVTFGSASVNVVVKDVELTGAEVAQILDVVTTQTDYAPGQVKVIQAQ